MSRPPGRDIGLLALALLGPGAVALAGLALGTGSVARQLPGLMLFVALLVAVWLLARRGGVGPEGLGLRRPGPMGWLVCVGLTGFFIFVYGPLAVQMLVRAGADLSAEAGRLAALPGWYLVPAIVIVAGGEEWLFRGVAIERMIALGLRPVVAGAVSLALFGLVHLPLWSAPVAASTLVAGAILTGLYLWRREVVSLIVAHVLTDLAGFGVFSGGDGCA